MPPIFNEDELTEAEKHIMHLAGAKLTTAEQWYGTLYPYMVTVPDGEAHMVYLSQAQVEELWTYADFENRGGTGYKKEALTEGKLTIDDLYVNANGALCFKKEGDDELITATKDDVKALSIIVQDLLRRVKALENPSD